MSVVSYETALKLKIADFPQPGLAVEQFWYSSEGETIEIKEGLRPVIINPKLIQPPGPEDLLWDGIMHFAPTAADIIEQMLNPESLAKNADAETCAAAWLEEQ